MDKNKKTSVKRKSARIPDSFTIKYKLVAQKDFEKKANIYKNRRTVERMENKEPDTNLLDLDWASFENEVDCNPVLIKILSYLDKKLEVILNKQNEILSNIHAQQKKEGIYKTGNCIDISGTGAKILVDKELDIKSILELSIEPPIYPPIRVVTLGKVIRISYKSKKSVYEVSLEFIAINEYDRENLIKYIFKRQRELILLKKRRNDYI